MSKSYQLHKDYEDFDQADELLKFFSLLERFNNDTPIKVELR